jgi:hypothetical protein
MNSESKKQLKKMFYDKVNVWAEKPGTGSQLHICSIINCCVCRLAIVN